MWQTKYEQQRKPNQNQQKFQKNQQNLFNYYFHCGIVSTIISLILFIGFCANFQNFLFSNDDKQQFNLSEVTTVNIENYENNTDMMPLNITIRNKTKQLATLLSILPPKLINHNQQFVQVKNNTKRSKRFVIFDGSGVVKIVLGTAFPVVLPDKKRSLGVFYNIQLQYVPTPVPLYWWSFYNTSTFAARKQRSADMLMQYDNSRGFIYEIMEKLFQRQTGNFGNKCLLKVICEMARAPLTEDLYGDDEYHDYEPEMLRTEQTLNAGDSISQQDEEDFTAEGYDLVWFKRKEDNGRIIFHKLINAIFTPIFPNANQKYLDAHQSGMNGFNCEKLYGSCTVADKWLKRFAIFI